jgi:hypothetical protein
MKNPDVQEKLVNEVYAKISDEDASNSVSLYETIKDMKYAHAV